MPPENVGISKFGFDIAHNVCKRLFKCAFENEKVTEKALQYLDSMNFPYKENLLKESDNISVTSAQFTLIMKHRNLASALREISCKAISTEHLPNFTIQERETINISDALGDGFETDEAPVRVGKYLSACENKTMLLEMNNGQYLPCNNVLVLSHKEPESSFAAFCAAIDPQDIFSARMNLKRASARLNAYDKSDSISPTDYMHNLLGIRMFVKDALGNGYKNYIDLILKAGTHPDRFIQELLQNADDCEYPDGVLPTFSLALQNGTITTEYNECGFTKVNVRAITAVGESTKEKLLGGKQDTIGEKGIGFKTIFAVASKVIITSGDFNFYLTDTEPTIPRAIKRPSQQTSGTKMVISLKQNQPSLGYDVKDILI